MRSTYILAFVAVLSGCVVVHDNPNPNPNPGPGGPPTYRIKPNAGTIIQPGVQAGYGVTANFGGSYRLVWTGDSASQYSNFRGTVYTPGRFTVFDPGCGGTCPDESNDLFTAPGTVVGGGEQFTFDAVTLTGIDGIDFGVSLEPVEFTLSIDGVSYPDLVFFPSTDSGGAIATPGEIPFQLTTQ
jgi:hypothetical protein